MSHSSRSSSSFPPASDSPSNVPQQSTPQALSSQQTPQQPSDSVHGNSSLSPWQGQPPPPGVQYSGRVAIPRRRLPGDNSGSSSSTSSVAAAVTAAAAVTGVASGSRSSQSASAGSSSRSSSRISHACEPCRIRKTKCSGKTPICSHCQAFGIACYYASNKRDRIKEELLNLRDKVQKYEQAIRTVVPSLDDANRNIVVNAFLSIPGSLPPHASVSRRPSDYDQAQLADDYDTVTGEDSVSAEVGSTGSVDHLNEDINSIGISAPEGYVGKSSDVDWIKKIFDISNDDDESEDDNFMGIMQVGIDNPSYNLDDIDLSIDTVDLSSVPPRYVADKLIDIYFETVHPSFPFILEPLFRYQYSLYCTGYLDDPHAQWAALYNLILAISSLYMQAFHEYQSLDPIQYYARAKILKPDLLVPGDVQHIQYVALLSFFLLASNHLNKAYIVLGLAVRQGQAAGLHLYINRAKLTEAQKEVRVRLWNAIYVLERIICALSGRPTAIRDDATSTALPSVSAVAENWEFLPQINVNRPPSQATKLNSKYFVHEIELSKILGQVLDRMYSTDIVKSSWSNLQGIMKDINKQLENWRANLTPIFDVNMQAVPFAPEEDTDATLARMRTVLAFQFLDVVRMTNRPCVCKVEIPNESQASKDFNRQCAFRCMQAGHSAMLLFPDFPPNMHPQDYSRAAVKVLPWWSIFHYIMSSISAMVLGYLMDIKPEWPTEHDILMDIDKCLNMLSKFPENLAARRCFDTVQVFKQKFLNKTTRAAKDVQSLSQEVSQQSMITTMPANAIQTQDTMQIAPQIVTTGPSPVPPLSPAAYYYSPTLGNMYPQYEMETSDISSYGSLLQNSAQSSSGHSEDLMRALQSGSPMDLQYYGTSSSLPITTTASMARDEALLTPSMPAQPLHPQAYQPNPTPIDIDQQQQLSQHQQPRPPGE
ncbi:fungal-specific transcription factor domain-containing protein [Limtongia smithiae]|uniref:fungal-specific transcription factor domain-containing protein n=1 Tax=Limtongia smithiae TaxID=1125753 RepID=UPI0034CD9228